MVHLLSFILLFSFCIPLYVYSIHRSSIQTTHATMAASTSAHNAAVAAEWIKDGRWDYSTPGSSGYHVPDITYDDPAARPLKVICIGAGFSGILNAYKIQKECQNVEFKIYEKNEDIGGTWLENRYPGCACDIPSHAYTYK